MTEKRRIWLFWAAFTLPGLALAAAAAVLLFNEQERLGLASVSALERQAGAAARTIHLTLEAVQLNLGQTLAALEGPDLESRLLVLEQENPLVRNVFIFNPEKGLAYPRPGLASTPEERRFMVRYDDLFKGRVPFDSGSGSDEEPAGGSGFIARTLPDQSGDSAYAEKRGNGLNRLLALSRKTGDPEAVLSDESVFAPKTVRTGWIPWFSQNRICLLGWVKPASGDLIFGMELEWMTLLSRMVVDFPVLEQQGLALALLDGSGRVMHQSGRPVDPEKEAAAAAVPVSPRLPHWRVAVYPDPDDRAAFPGFLAVSLLLVGLFILAMVFGGVQLSRMTLARARDAREKTSFVSSVSHELKTPLTSIRMYAELLKHRRVTDPEKSDQYLSAIVDQSSRLTRLINNVLDFGRLEQGRKQYRICRVDLDELLNRVIRENRTRLEAAGLEIRSDLPGRPLMVRTDPDAVEQVVLNLADNCLKYAAGGGQIAFFLHENRAGADIGVCDRGPGIPRVHRKKIFEKFHRVDDSLTAAQPGSGLGLSIARQLVRGLGGDLVYRDRAGGGACFTAGIAGAKAGKSTDSGPGNTNREGA